MSYNKHSYSNTKQKTEETTDLAPKGKGKDKGLSKNALSVSHARKLSSLPMVPIDDAQAVQERIELYFALCEADDAKPSVAGLALSLNINKEYLWRLRTGQRGKNKDVEAALQKAMRVLEFVLVDALQTGRVNPAAGIFLLKNNFGYADEQHIVITPVSPLGEIRDLKELEARYGEIIEGDAVDVTETHKDAQPTTDPSAV